MRIEGVSSSTVIHKPQPVNNEDRLNKTIIDSKSVDVSISNEEQEHKKLTEEELIHAIEKANKSVNIYDRRLEFSIHEETKEIMVKVIDTSTDEVIREIPPEKILDMVAKMWELAGILVDEKA